MVTDSCPKGERMDSVKSPKTVEEMAGEWVKNYAKPIPGCFDYAEGIDCFIAGFHACEDRSKKLVEALEKIVIRDGECACGENRSCDCQTEMEAIAEAALKEWRKNEETRED